MNSVRRLVSSASYHLKIRAPVLCAILAAEYPFRTPPDLSVARPALNHAIPNVVYQSWITKQFGRRHASELSGFRRENEEFTFEFYDQERIDTWMHNNWNHHPIFDIYARSRFGPLQVDIWRYCVIYSYGGVYCDISKTPNVPLREMLFSDPVGLISFERNLFQSDATSSSAILYPDHQVINWMFAFAPEHPLLQLVIDEIVLKYPLYRGKPVEDPKAAILKFTGPWHLTECLHKYASHSGLAGIVQAGIDFYGRGVFDMPGSFARYTQRGTYARAKKKIIVS